MFMVTVPNHRGLATLRAALSLTICACVSGPRTGVPQPSEATADGRSAVGAEPRGCTQEHGRTSAEFREGVRLVPETPSSARAALVAFVTDGFVRPGSAASAPISDAIVEYRSRRADDARTQWLGRLRADTAVAGRYVADSIPPGSYEVRTRAIAHKAMTYEIVLPSGYQATLRIELAGASLCLGAPTTRSHL